MFISKAKHYEALANQRIGFDKDIKNLEEQLKTFRREIVATKTLLVLFGTIVSDLSGLVFEPGDESENVIVHDPETGHVLGLRTAHLDLKVSEKK